MHHLSDYPNPHLSREPTALGVPRLWQELHSLKHLLPRQGENVLSADEAAELAIYFIQKKVIDPFWIRADNLKWGDHICQFYKTKNEALRRLVPFFAKGLSGNDKCLWMTSPRLSREDVQTALSEMAGDLDSFFRSGQLEIIDYRNMYLTPDGNYKKTDQLLALWGGKAAEALEKGFDGLRATGDPASFHNLTDWNAFMDFESKVQHAIGSMKMIAICTYHIDSCQDSNLPEIMAAHGSAICEKSNQWHILHSKESHLTDGMDSALRSLRQLRN